MASKKNKTLFTQTVRVSEDASLNLKTVQLDEMDMNGKPKYETTGTVIYDDGAKVKLEPIMASNNCSYIWKNGNIYRMNGNDIEHSVFTIKCRDCDNLFLDWAEKRELIVTTTPDNMSVPFYNVIDLPNGNRMLVNRFWDRESSLIDSYYLLNKEGQVYYISSRVVSSSNIDVICEGVVWDEENIYFYHYLRDNEVAVTRSFNVTHGKPVGFQWAPVQAVSNESKSRVVMILAQQKTAIEPGK